MRTVLAFLLSGILLIVVGCQNMNDDRTMATGADACPMCEGVQKMTTEGTCEKCKMAVDACSHCAGNQTLTADGKCPACGMKMAKK